MYLSSGMLLGLTAGISPGPLLTLVVSETLRHNVKEGIKVAVAPLITDLPIILLTAFILSRLSNMKPILGVISLSGALFLFFLAYESVTTQAISLHIQKVKPQSLKKGIFTNLLNPSPYIFWFAVGSPTILKASESSIFSSALFLAGFYICIIGSKVLIAALVEKSRNFLNSRIYVNVQRCLGIALLGFGLSFLKDGLRLFGFV